MQKHNIHMSRENVECVDTLRYLWDKVRQQVTELNSLLLEIQPKFRTALVDSVKQYKVQVDLFIKEYLNVSQLSPSNTVQAQN